MRAPPGGRAAPKRSGAIPRRPLSGHAGPAPRGFWAGKSGPVDRRPARRSCQCRRGDRASRSLTLLVRGGAVGEGTRKLPLRLPRAGRPQTPGAQSLLWDCPLPLPSLVSGYLSFSFFFRPCLCLCMCVYLFLIILAVSALPLQLSTRLCPFASVSLCLSCICLSLPLHLSTSLCLSLQITVSLSSCLYLCVPSFHSLVLFLFSGLRPLGAAVSPLGQPGETSGHCPGSSSRSPTHAVTLARPPSSLCSREVWRGGPEGRTQCPASAQEPRGP